MMFKRAKLQTLKTRVKETRKFIQVILGPRQVGKTTIVNQLLNEINIPYRYVTADNIEHTDTTWIEEQWEIARLQKQTQNTGDYLLVFDEIQKIQNWSEAVKAEWDKDSFNNNSIKVILLGSAQLILQKGLSESLTGRFEVIPLVHWSFQEMHEAFGFTEEQYVWFGSYPGAAVLIGDEDRWKDYILHSLIETTISKDIFQLTRIDKPALLKRLFELSCFYSGQILSYTKMLGQLHDAGNTTTLSHYLNLLDSAGLVSGLEKYTLEKVRQKSSSPKLQVQNTALMSALSDNTFENIIMQPKLWGRFVEAAVGSHLINFSKQDKFNVYYWRDRNQEVDFVIEKRGKTIGIEVKSGYKQITTGMNAFKKKFNPHKLILISNTGLSWKEFIKINPLELF